MHSSSIRRQMAIGASRDVVISVGTQHRHSTPTTPYLNWMNRSRIFVHPTMISVMSHRYLTIGSTKNLNKIKNNNNNHPQQKNTSTTSKINTLIIFQESSTTSINNHIFNSESPRVHADGRMRFTKAQLLWKNLYFLW